MSLLIMMTNQKVFVMNCFDSIVFGVGCPFFGPFFRRQGPAPAENPKILAAALFRPPIAWPKGDRRRLSPEDRHRVAVSGRLNFFLLSGLPRKTLNRTNRPTFVLF